MIFGFDRWFSVCQGQKLQGVGRVFLPSVSKDLCQDFLCTPAAGAGSTCLLQAGFSCLTPEGPMVGVERKEKNM